jgi:hypothetical protein
MVTANLVKVCVYKYVINILYSYYILGIYQIYIWYISVICRHHQYARYIPTSQLMSLFHTFYI